MFYLSRFEQLATDPMASVPECVIAQLKEMNLSWDKVIGHGAYGFVARVCDNSTGKPVCNLAVKVQSVKMGSREDQNRLDMFEKEKELLAIASAAGAAPPYFSDIEGQCTDGDIRQLYYGMEFVVGETLTEWLWNRHPNVPWKQFTQVIDGVLQRLILLLDVGIMHNDTKGDNIIIQKGNDTPWIIDYGLSEHNPNMTEAEKRASFEEAQYVLLMTLSTGLKKYSNDDQAVSVWARMSPVKQDQFYTNLQNAIYSRGYDDM